MAERNSPTYPNVHMGPEAEIDDFVILGNPPGDKRPGELETRLGARARLRSFSVIYAGVVIGDDFQCGHHAMIRESTIIGDRVSIGTGSVVEHHVTIEDEVRIHSNAFVPEYSTLRRGCWLGPNVVLTNAKYPRSPGVKENLAGPTVMPGAKLGANVTVLPGVTIGENALVGAGSVVVEDIPAKAVAVGNPARVIKTLDDLPYGENTA